MADRLFFIASSPEDLVRGNAIPSEMIDDLLQIARIAPTTIDRIIVAIEGAVGFLDEDRLLQLVEDAVPDERTAAALVRTLHNLRPGRTEPAIELLRDWREADPQNAERFPEKTLAVLEGHLARLIRSYPAWDRHRKAARLRSLTGNQAHQLDLICDARPVYDSNRQHIEGFLTLITLRLGYETQAEESSCLELRLSAKQLDDLFEKVQKAQEKLASLREAIRRWIPDGLADTDD